MHYLVKLCTSENTPISIPASNAPIDASITNIVASACVSPKIRFGQNLYDPVSRAPQHGTYWS